MLILAQFAIGLIFGLGLVIAGMSNPAKVLNFLDVAGIGSGQFNPAVSIAACLVKLSSIANISRGSVGWCAIRAAAGHAAARRGTPRVGDSQHGATCAADDDRRVLWAVACHHDHMTT